MFSEEPERPTKRKKFDESNNHNSSGFQKASLTNNRNIERPKLEKDSHISSINNNNDTKLGGESEMERKQRLEIEALKRQLAESKNSSSSSRQEEDIPTEFQLSSKRKITVRDFRGKALIDIREFYAKDSGELAPGRKGISLTVEQYEKFKSYIEDIDKAIENL
jgi:hypothetical protein